MKINNSITCKIFKRISFSLIFLIFHSSAIFSQNNDNTIQQIFDNIILSIGNSFPEAPKLKLNQRIDAAEYNSSNKTISIDSKIYKICRTFKSDSLNAMAYILGHELAHHYLNHGWLDENYDDDDQNLSFIKHIKLNTNDSIKQMECETQADLYGGFFAHIAGYNSLKIAPSLLKKIYKEYELKDKLRNYPTLSERQVIVQKQLEKLEELKSVFDAASIALASGFYPGAEEGFDFIIKKGFTSREIYNNLGLSYLLEAMDKAKSKVVFAYPFEFDAETRLNTDNSRDVNTDIKLSIELLKSAIKAINRSLIVAPDYKPALINYICANSILAELDSVNRKTYLTNATTKINDVKDYDKQKWEVLNAIILYQTDNKENGLIEFKNCASSGNVLAQLNYNNLNDIKNIKTNTYVLNKMMSMNKMNLESVLQKLNDLEEPLKYYKLENYRLYIKFIDSTQITYFKGANKRKSYILQSTNASKYISSKGLKVGMNSQAALNMYPENNQLSSANCSYYKCGKDNITFKTNNGKVIFWTLFLAED
jgi:hypothetical protein